MVLGIVTVTLSSFSTGLSLSIVSSNLCSITKVDEKREILGSHDSGDEDGHLQECGF